MKYKAKSSDKVHHESLAAFMARGGEVKKVTATGRPVVKKQSVEKLKASIDYSLIPEELRFK